MPILRDLLSQAELDLLRLASLPVPFEEFLLIECPNVQACHLIAYNALATIPGADVGPPKKAGNEGWASPYRDYEGWLAWFVRQPIRQRRRRRKKETNPADAVTGLGADSPNVDDPAVRLAVVNAQRARRGLPPLSEAPATSGRVPQGQETFILGASVSGKPPWPKQPSRSARLAAAIAAWDEGGRQGQMPTLADISPDVPRAPRQRRTRQPGQNPLADIGTPPRASQRQERPSTQNPLMTPRGASRPVQVGDRVIFRGNERTIVRIMGNLIWLSSGASVYREDVTLIEGE